MSLFEAMRLAGPLSARVNRGIVIGGIRPGVRRAGIKRTLRFFHWERQNDLVLEGQRSGPKLSHLMSRLEGVAHFECNGEEIPFSDVKENLPHP